MEAVADDGAIGNSPLAVNGPDQDPFRNKCRRISLSQGRAGAIMRKLIAFDEATFDKLKQLGRGGETTKTTARPKIRKAKSR
ncbi:hypothetical protein ACQ86E_01370 [Bradyrhizobium betae]|jgi:hypothetical protein|uniref:hypothetical protein n=1 Tax=Bradyrhizobium betae TaxID=244734 RepID=UPI003D6786C1